MERAKLPDNFSDRPDDYLGESVSSYLQSPRRKLKTSWLDKGDGELEQTAGDDKPQRRNSGSMISQRLSELNKQNETCQAKNDASQVRDRRHSHHPAAASKQSAKKSDDTAFSDKTASTESTRSSEPDATKNQHKLSLTRKDVQFLVERPDDWLGGEGEEAEVATYLQKPKTKLRTSWLQKSKEDTQSLRDLSSGPSNKSKQPHANLHASESQLDVGPAERRKTSPMVMQQLSALKQKNEENHQKNEDLAIQKDSSHKKSVNSQTNKAANAPESGPAEGAVTPSSQSKEKVRVQRELKAEELHLLDRPDTWMGGEGEDVEQAYLRKAPKAKLKTSWLADGGSGMSQSMRDVTSVRRKDDHDDLNASDSNFFSSRRKKTTGSSLVIGKLADFQKQNEENHKRNEELAPVVSATAKSATTTKAGKEPSKPSVKIAAEADKPKAEVVRIQRELKAEELHLLDRPDAWMGGEGEEVEHSYLRKAPKAKLKTSWLADGGSGMSQSMRDVTSAQKKNAHDELNASDHHLYSSRRRNTSSLVMGKLADFQQKDEENHKRNEDLSPVVSTAAKRSTTTRARKEPSKPSVKIAAEADKPKAEVVRVQRELKDDELHLLKRPDTWMGGEGDEHSYLRKAPKAKLKTSWLADGGSGMSQSMRDVTSVPKKKAHDELNASDHHLYSSRRRNTSSLVMEKLADFQQKDEENHKRNEYLSPVVSTAAKRSTTTRARKEPSNSSVKIAAEADKPKAEVVRVQRELKDDELHLLKRPDTWMGGEGDEHSYLQKAPKAKLKTSWLAGEGSGMSQSMRDVTSVPKKKAHDELNASDHHLYSSGRKNTSSLIMGKLADFQKQSTENHKRNEDLATVSERKVDRGEDSSQVPGLVSMKKQAEEANGGESQSTKTGIKLQRDGVEHLVARPDDWLGR